MALTGGSAIGKMTVAVLAGGRSSEHDVSLSSGAAVRDGLLEAGHEVVWVEIARDGSWRRDAERLSVTPGTGLLGVDVAFPVLHGPFGEDGTIQGALETLDVAYVGSGVGASAVSLNKVMFKELMSAAGTPQVRFAGVDAERFTRARAEVLDELASLGLPVFVKPAHLGSSVGIVKAADAGAVEDALEEAFMHDGLVIVESLAQGLEVECGVLGTLRAERDAGARPAAASVPGEIVLPGEWYDFEAKYTPGGMELKIPASISAAADARVRELALEAFRAAGCDGLARVDFFVQGDHVVLNELNTMPGFTPTSVYAKLMAASGTAYPQLVEKLCRLALERHEQRRPYRH
ncbi:MAG: D-alanine-D-alanine ligase [Solirubrobacteraceae bacterium]|nr:D-alanine-D-alanine ligase [Solirubrobacteraceae bacterium]